MHQIYLAGVAGAGNGEQSWRFLQGLSCSVRLTLFPAIGKAKHSTYEHDSAKGELKLLSSGRRLEIRFLQQGVLCYLGVCSIGPADRMLIIEAHGRLSKSGSCLSQVGGQ